MIIPINNLINIPRRHLINVCLRKINMFTIKLQIYNRVSAINNKIVRALNAYV